MLQLSLATWDHDRVMALHDGRIGVSGVEFESHMLPTSKLFPMAVQSAKFDITELSISSYLLQVSQGASRYTAIPAFVSRAFRHSGFYVSAEAGIDRPEQLAGRRVGVPEYQMTAALWMRGILADEFGVDTNGIHWRTGALDEGVRRERLTLDLPAGMLVEPIEEGETLQSLLLAGEIDALLAPKPPMAFLEKDRRIRRLFPDFERVEQDYFTRTGLFPIMHLIAVRSSVVDENPWLPRALFDAFLSARDMAMHRLRDIWLGSANRLSLPWLNASMERTYQSLGPNYWPYGFKANERELDVVCRYSHDQHLAVRRVAPEELFHQSMLET